MEQKYTINQVSAMTGLSTRTIRNYLKSGLIDGEKTEGVWLFSAEDFANMLNNPAIKPSIKAKNNAVVFDFMADDRKKVNKICTILDLYADDEEGAEISQFFCDAINNDYGEADLTFKFEKYGRYIRIILSGGEDVVSDLINRYYNE